MCFKNLFKKKIIWPEDAKYQKRDFVRFKYRGEVCFGFIYDVKKENGVHLYTIQMGGECPTFAYNYKEDDIIGYVPKN
jgi:hypothetical protein